MVLCGSLVPTSYGVVTGMRWDFSTLLLFSTGKRLVVPGPSKFRKPPMIVHLVQLNHQQNHKPAPFSLPVVEGLAVLMELHHLQMHQDFFLALEGDSVLLVRPFSKDMTVPRMSATTPCKPIGQFFYHSPISKRPHTISKTHHRCKALCHHLGLTPRHFPLHMSLPSHKRPPPPQTLKLLSECLFFFGVFLSMLARAAGP